MESISCERNYSEDKPNREAKESQTHESQNQLLAPIIVVDVREEAKTLIHEVAKASRGNDHKDTHSGPTQQHRRVNQNDSEQPAHNELSPIRALCARRIGNLLPGRDRKGAGALGFFRNPVAGFRLRGNALDGNGSKSHAQIKLVRCGRAGEPLAHQIPAAV